MYGKHFGISNVSLGHAFILGLHASEYEETCHAESMIENWDEAGETCPNA
jgi:hypothetical protein